jgi:hypothetical protein
VVVVAIGVTPCIWRWSSVVECLLSLSNEDAYACDDIDVTSSDDNNSLICNITLLFSSLSLLLLLLICCTYAHACGVDNDEGNGDDIEVDGSNGFDVFVADDIVGIDGIAANQVQLHITFMGQSS